MTAKVELYWLPLGAGGHFVRWNGRMYEALMAAMHRRPRCDLYHSALDVTCASGRFVVPDLVWGRDENGTGDMWNSNSVTSWLLERSGIDTDCARPPAGGRAPGWDAGVALGRSG